MFFQYPKLDKVFHVYNRGVDKRRIFMDRLDYQRFLRGMDQFNDENRSRSNSIAKYCCSSSAKSPFVGILAYCLMPNHYHLLLSEQVMYGMSLFMARIGNGYTKYFNIRHGRSGRLFASKYQSVPVRTDAQLIQVIDYIHSNPNKLKVDSCETLSGSRETIRHYPWSSLEEYETGEGFSLCEKSIVCLHRGGCKYQPLRLK